MQIYQPKVGDDVEDACKSAVALAQETKEIIAFSFNGVRLKADPDTKPETLIEKFQQELQKQTQAYQESPEAKKEAEHRSQEILYKQSQLDVLQASLKMILGRKDPNKTLQWLVKFAELADDVAMKYDAGKIIKELTKAGYTENDFVGVHESIFTTPYRLEHYIVGQAINCVKNNLLPHPVITEKLYDDWIYLKLSAK